MVLILRCKLTQNRSRGDKLSKLLTLNACNREHLLVELFSRCVHYLTRSGYGILCSSNACEQVVESIWHKEYLVDLLYIHKPQTIYGVKLKDSVKRHKLDARTAVEFLCRHLLKICLHSPFGVASAIAVWQRDKIAILAEICHIATPGINADTAQLNALFVQKCECRENLVI